MLPLTHKARSRCWYARPGHPHYSLIGYRVFKNPSVCSFCLTLSQTRIVRACVRPVPGGTCVYTRYDIGSVRSLPAPGVRALARDRCYKLATMHNSVMLRLSPVGSRPGGRGSVRGWVWHPLTTCRLTLKPGAVAAVSWAVAAGSWAVASGRAAGGHPKPSMEDGVTSKKLEL